MQLLLLLLCSWQTSPLAAEWGNPSLKHDGAVNGCARPDMQAGGGQQQPCARQPACPPDESWRAGLLLLGKPAQLRLLGGIKSRRSVGKGRRRQGAARLVVSNPPLVGRWCDAADGASRG